MAAIARRSFLTGLAALMAAPAIVKASALMPLRGDLIASTGWSPNYFGLSVRNEAGWRMVSRINIDGLASGEPPDLFALMARTLMSAPGEARKGFFLKGCKIVCDQETAMHSDLQAMRDRNVLLVKRSVQSLLSRTPHERTFRGVPIEVVL
jgi:hypothetical protein